MGNTIFTATGCSRCKIAKKFMDEHAIPFQELDIKAEGKDPFGQFYRNNRSSVYRGKEGIEFPVFTDGRSSVRAWAWSLLFSMRARSWTASSDGANSPMAGWMGSTFPRGTRR